MVPRRGCPSATAPLMRIALGIEYDGTDFSGWERQPGARSVAEVLERALSEVAAHRISTACAGRTDARVHAVGQVAHFDTEARRPDRGWVLGANTHLPGDVAVRWACRPGEDFHARFSALRRHYRYVIHDHALRSPLLRHRAARCRRALDVTRMRCAADALTGEHDFSAYRASGCQARSPVRTIHALRVERHGDFVVIDVCANAFLQHMVRNIAGVLQAIGGGERPVEWAARVLASRDRRQGGVTAPPEGLYLTRVEYAERFPLPSVSRWKPLW